MIAINIGAAGCNISKEIDLIKKVLEANGYNVNILNEDKQAPLLEEDSNEVNIIADYEPWMA